ncbi:stalk domain-containing protein [Paenibacillus spongiae]|uniref:Carboxypeptidase regulatory-like domain-containing protein n=1 Tax=Paenibacillus spongiae TaxID=2909671 RepID=A0ABY5S744_9BACL|nr:carboxypeptidase regulatory-like domain-containing protein [Paenibacillus spongiae]UVI29405.1 carboxypeptidase regulatory-like domain-containing protein [Paenibacillus spongiae]
MKRRIAVAVALLMVWTMSGAYSMSAASSKIVIDGRELNLSAPPVQADGMTWVPFRSLFEGLGLRVGWDAKKQQITGTSADASVEIRLGSLDARVNGKAAKLGAAPFTRDGVTYVPLRFVSEAVNRDVQWDRISGVISIGARKTNSTAGTPTNDNGQSAAAEGQLTGRVLSPSGEPVAGAKVVADYAGLNEEFTVEVTTDSEGRYEVSGVLKDYTLFVHAKPPLNSREYVASEPVQVKNHTLAQSVDLILNKVDVTGSIVDEQGNPVANQRVAVFEGDSATSDKSYMTDGNGEFHIGGLSRGKRYRIIAMEPIHQSVTPEEYTFIYRSVDPRPVIVVKQNFALIMAVNQDGKPIDTNQYSIVIRNDQNQFDVNMKLTPAYEAYRYDGLKPGDRYRVEIRFGDENSSYENPAPYSFTFDPSAKEPLRVSVTSKSPVQFMDTIVDEQGNPVGNARVRIVDRSDSTEKIFLTDGNGKVSIRGLQPGREYRQFVEPYSWGEELLYLYGKGSTFTYYEGVTSLPERTLYRVQLKINTADVILDPSHLLMIFVKDESGNSMPVVYVGNGYFGTGKLEEGKTYKVSATYFRSIKESSSSENPKVWKEEPDPVTFVYKAGMEPIVLKSKTPSS